MRIAVFGGSGFIGCHFVREALKRGLEPVVYSGSTGGLANLCRLDVDLRLYRASELADLEIPEDLDLLVNFANPSSSRQGETQEAQIRGFLQLFERFLQRPGARLIHYSTVAVYEPFSPGVEAREEDSPDPPKGDAYAVDKLAMDRGLQALNPEGDRLLLLRPSIVYGPFGRFWTDHPLVALAAGDLPVGPLAGRMQPVYVGDLARFTVERCLDFRPGLYNMAGPETMTWRDYYRFHEGVVGGGRLVDRAAAGPERSRMENLRADLREVKDLLEGSPAVQRLLRRVGRYLPGPLGRPFYNLGLRLSERRVGGSDTVDLSPPPGPEGPAVPGATPHRGYLYSAVRDVARDRYEADLLVSIERFTRDFPDFRLTALEGNRELLGDYFRFRFTDEALT